MGKIPRNKIITVYKSLLEVAPVVEVTNKRPPDFWYKAYPLRPEGPTDAASVIRSIGTNVHGK